MDDLRGLVLLGCGKMGGAMLEGWLSGGLAPGRVTVLEPYPTERLKALAHEGLRLNPPALDGAADFAVVAVKPQMMAEAAPRLQPMAAAGTAFLSIAAGTTIAFFEGLFGKGAPVIRAMPNTPAAIGRGITAYIGNEAATEAHLATAARLLAACGETVRLDSEAQIDAVTGLSGSGPAYVFHMVEAMAAAGEAAGLAPDMAMRLARATVSGAGALADASDETAEQLRINVTSPGGTTAAGLEVLMPELTGLMTRTVAAATARARKLAG